jgi:hypothetical protein
VTDVANGGSQEIAPLILRPKQYQIDEALAHLCNQVRQIDLVISSDQSVSLVVISQCTHSSNVNVLSHERVASIDQALAVIRDAVLSTTN